MKKIKQFSHKVILIILSIILGNLLIPACEQNSPPQISAELIGTWITDKAPYTDRSIEIYEDFLLFETGEKASYTLMINNVDYNPEKKGIIKWTLSCLDIEGNPSKIIVFYKPARENTKRVATIQLNHIKKITWYKIL